MGDATNPRAFPSAAIDDAFGGMTLADYAALRVLSCFSAEISGSPEQLAKDCFGFADAFLAERSRRMDLDRMVAAPEPEFTKLDLNFAARALHDAGHLATADFQRIVNRIRAVENVREGADG